jgi:hypothetical protein
MPHRWGRAILWSLPLAALVLLLGTLAVTQSGDDAEPSADEKPAAADQVGAGPIGPDDASTTTTQPPFPTTSTFPPEPIPGVERPASGDGFGPHLRVLDPELALADLGTVVGMDLEGTLTLVDAGDEVIATFAARVEDLQGRRATIARPTATLVYEGPEVRAVDLATGEHRTLGTGRYPSVSPDGTQVAHLDTTCPATCQPEESMDQVVLRELDGTELHRWTAAELGPLDGLHGVAWSEDGASLYVTRSNPAREGTLGQPTGPSPLLYRLDAGDRATTFGDDEQVNLPPELRRMPSTYWITHPSRWHPIGEHDGRLLISEEESVSRAVNQGAIEVDLDDGAQLAIRPIGGVAPNALTSLRPCRTWHSSAGEDEVTESTWLPPPANYQDGAPIPPIAEARPAAVAC